MWLERWHKDREVVLDQDHDWVLEASLAGLEGLSPFERVTRDWKDANILDMADALAAAEEHARRLAVKRGEAYTGLTREQKETIRRGGDPFR